MLGHCRIPRSIALLALSLFRHIDATLFNSTATQTIGTADQLPIVDLGYALYKPTNYNVSPSEFLKDIHVDLKPFEGHGKVLQLLQYPLRRAALGRPPLRRTAATAGRTEAGSPGWRKGSHMPASCSCELELAEHRLAGRAGDSGWKLHAPAERRLPVSGRHRTREGVRKGE